MELSHPREGGSCNWEGVVNKHHLELYWGSSALIACHSLCSPGMCVSMLGKGRGWRCWGKARDVNAGEGQGMSMLGNTWKLDSMQQDAWKILVVTILYISLNIIPSQDKKNIQRICGSLLRCLITLNLFIVWMKFIDWHLLCELNWRNRFPFTRELHCFRKCS